MSREVPDQPGRGQLLPAHETLVLPASVLVPSIEGRAVVVHHGLALVRGGGVFDGVRAAVEEALALAASVAEGLHAVGQGGHTTSWVGIGLEH